ncbi:MAG: DMT family transporter [Blastomonas sp.]
MTNAMERGGLLALLALIGANCALAFGPWLVRLADTGPVAAGFWRLGLAIPFLYVMALRDGQPLGGYRPRVWLLLALGGIAFGLDLASWHYGIARTKLANATLFGNAGSIIMVLYGFLIGRAWPQAIEWLAVGLAVLGAALLMGSSYELAFDNLVGDLFCLGAGLFYAVYLITLRDARASLGSWQVLAHATLFGAPVALLCAIALGERVLPGDWTPVLVLAFSSQVFGQGLMVYALRHFSPLVIGLALLTQPAIAATVGWLAFGEQLQPVDLVGMVAIALALVLVRLPEARRARAARGVPVAADPGRA